MDDLSQAEQFPNDVRELHFDRFSSSESLAAASRQARQRKYNEFLIVDVDAHHYESESYADVFSYIDSPVIRHAAKESTGRGGRSSLMNSMVGYQDIGGGGPRPWLRQQRKTAPGAP